MMKGEWSFFNPTTGMFTKRRFRGSDHLLAINTPVGAVPLFGVFDPLSKRVDIAALALVEGGNPADFVVDYQPPRPDADHEWDAVRRRWRKTSEAGVREFRDRKARERLREIDIALVRPLLQLRTDPTHAVALASIAELEAEATSLRGDIIATPEEIERAERLRQP